MKSINIKGKEYIEVNERLKFFRNSPNYRGFALVSEMLHLDSEWCCIKASILTDTGGVIATGIAYEKADSSFINKTSFVENCETSAWGRALGNLGIGIDTAVATAEEVQNAIKNQEPKQTTDKKPNTLHANVQFLNLCAGKGLTEDEINDLKNWAMNAKKESDFSKIVGSLVDNFEKAYAKWMEGRL
jgi:hypothetical protein